LLVFADTIVALIYQPKQPNIPQQVSLYPKVMKADEYPMGAPIVLTPDLLEQDQQRWPCPWRNPGHLPPYRGLLLVRIEPPAQMDNNSRLPPFLPYRSTVGGNLLFPLCAKCSDMQCLGPCRHNHIQRSWVAAFPHQDIELALRLGYTVHEVFEVGWNFD
jgi:hypothetical protein